MSDHDRAIRFGTALETADFTAAYENAHFGPLTEDA
jgi:hypothetical protein